MNNLKALAKGENIEFHINSSESELKEIYNKSRIYWHAAGFGRNPEHPQNAEHFGMTTLEAMSYGCIPFAYADGGQIEILKNGPGYLWSDIDQLLNDSIRLINNEEKIKSMALDAAAYAINFDFPKFKLQFEKLMDRM